MFIGEQGLADLFLGVVPTRRAVAKSLYELKTNYVDMYLPTGHSVIEESDWHHCQDIEDVAGNWKQSWKASKENTPRGVLCP